MRLPKDLFSEALTLPDLAMVYELGERVCTAAHDLAILKTQDYAFNPAEYAASGGCELRVRGDAAGLWLAHWDEHHVRLSPKHAAFDVVWRGQHLTLVSIDPDCDPRFWIVAGESLALCERFFATVCNWYSASSDAISVFDNGGFVRDEELREEISGRTLDSLCLSDSIRQALQTGVLDFFASMEIYARHGIPWKRGVILHGPPGNGKTQTIQALVNQLKLPTIYVRSLHARWDSPEDCIRHIYRRARQASPAIVVLEDIDSLITPGNRSYFLNELDGFRKLNGLMTIATTNHLENLDVAIRDRPSRFDEKILFDNPDLETRKRYLSGVIGKWQLVVSPEQLDKVSNETNGFSFAGLQELTRSALMNSLRNSQDPFSGLIKSSEEKSESKKRKKKKSS